MSGDKLLFLSAQKDENILIPQVKDFYEIGTVVRVKQMLKIQGDGVRVLVDGLYRAKISSVITVDPYFMVETEELKDVPADPAEPETQALMRLAQYSFDEYADLAEIKQDIPDLVNNIKDPGAVVSHLTSVESKAVSMAEELAGKLNTVIAISGKIDVISDGKRSCVLRNGCATMARITGSGCMLTSLIGAFCGACNDAFLATCSAMAAMGISGEIAEAKRLRNGTGNATFRNDLIDAVFNLTQEQLRQGVRYEIYKR